MAPPIKTGGMEFAEQTIYARVGNLLKAARKDKGWTQLQLAENSGISKDMVARIERGGTGVRFPTLLKLSGALRIDPADLFIVPLHKGPDQSLLNDIAARLATLSPAELEWIDRVIDAALKPKG